MDTGLDKSLPHIGVLMVCPSPRERPCFSLPEGFSIRFYRPGMEAGWAKIQWEAGQVDSLAEGERLFEKTYGSSLQKAARQLLFAKAPGGELVGTASLWDGAHFGETRQRVHWVAVSPAHQGKGIAKALLSRLMGLYGELGYPGPLYLTSQTWSWRALNLYGKLGFRPYFGEKPVNWQMDPGLDFQEENRRAWELIFTKIPAIPGAGCWRAKRG